MSRFPRDVRLRMLLVGLCAAYVFGLVVLVAVLVIGRIVGWSS